MTVGGNGFSLLDDISDVDLNAMGLSPDEIKGRTGNISDERKARWKMQKKKLFEAQSR